MAQQTDAIEALYGEDRKFPPPPDFQARANVKDDAIYQRAEADFVALLGRAGEDARLVRAVDTRSWSGTRPFAKWFVGGKLNVSYNCLDRHVNGRARRQGRLLLGRRAGRPPHDHLRRTARRGLPLRQRAEGTRRQARRPRRDLHADDPRTADRDARLRPDRRAAHRRLRRLLRRGAAPTASTTPRRSVVITADGGFRRGRPCGAEGASRRSAGRDARRRARRSSCAAPARR